MNMKETLTALDRLKLETGSLACLGCGHEHNCGIHGCAIIRSAAEHLQMTAHTFPEPALLELAAQYLGTTPERLRELVESDTGKGVVWISVKDRLPERFAPVIVCREGAKDERIVEQGHRDVGEWWKVYGTRTKHITHWMPLPEPPKGETE